MRVTRRTFWARAAIVAASVAVTAIIVWNTNDAELIIFGKSGSYPHYIQVTVPSAFEATPGERITEGGIGVGTITEANVTKDAEAHLRMGIESNGWPIPTNSMLNLRMGGTAKFTDRFVAITKGNAATYFADNAYIPAKRFVVPVEYAAVFNIFNKHTRAGLRGFFNNIARLAPAATPFRRALNDSAPALGQVASVVGDLGYDQQALSTLVASTATVSDAVASSNPGVRTLLDGAAGTFSTVANQSRGLRDAISAGGSALHSAGTLGRVLTNTLYHVAPLAARLSPGLTQLTGLARPLTGTLQEVVNIEPSAVATLNTITRSGPRIGKLLDDARVTLMPELKSVARQAVPQLACVRPYTPDIISLFQGWAGFFGDGLTSPHVHFMHTYVSLLPFPNDVPLDSGQITKLFPNLKSYFPEPPGLAWNQPWPQPQCGLTAAKLTQDPEAHTFDPHGSKLLPYGPTTTPSFGTKVG